MVHRISNAVRQRFIGARKSRAGLTTLEFVGCTIAVVGGAWLGALYLGVDVRHLAHTALSEAELLEKVPPEWRPPGPNENAMTREQLVATLRQELGTLRSEIVALRTSAGDVDTDRTSDAATLVKQRTLAYWLRLNEIALGEAALQQDAETAFNETNAAKVFAIKGRVSSFAAKAVEAVPSGGVDPAVVEFGQQLGDWYEDAGELYERAAQIWDLPAANQTRAQLNKDWRAAELDHRNKARLLNERASAVRSAAGRQFGEEFPEFAKPFEASASGKTAPAAR